MAVSQQHKNEDVVGNETVEEKRGAAVNVVVHVDDGDKGDDRQEVIGSDNTGGGGAKTDGIAAREQKEAMDSEGGDGLCCEGGRQDCLSGVLVHGHQGGQHEGQWGER